MNQIEVHPGLNNDAARQGSLRHGVAVEAWSPLTQGKALDDETINQMAERHGRTNAQVVLRWHTQHGHIVIAKTTHKERMEENLDLFGFELSEADMEAIDALDKGESGRFGPNPDTFDWLPSSDAGS